MLQLVSPFVRRKIAPLAGALFACCAPGVPAVVVTPGAAVVALPPPITPAAVALPPTPAPAVAQAEASVVAEPPSASPFRRPVVARDRSKAIVLMYHTMGLIPGKRHAVHPRQLDDQLGWMAQRGIEVVTTHQLVAFLEGSLDLPERVVVITFDDAERSMYTFAYPVLLRHRAAFTLALPTMMMEMPKGDTNLSWDHVREMRDSGLCQIVSHTHTHAMLPDLGDTQVHAELSRASAIIAERTGVTPDVLFYPFGATSVHLGKLLQRAGYRAGFVAWGYTVDAGVPRMSVPRFAVLAETTLADLERYFDIPGPARGPAGRWAR